jgi:uncharacterized protein (TIGR02001 family)
MNKSLLKKFKKPLLTSAITVAALAAAVPSQAEVTANAGIANNYIWRGLTQTINEAVVSGGLDYAHESGFYAGTWAANVSYDSDDAYSYEHDMYFGFGGEAASFGYDIGYLYYNYDSQAGFDFGEIYGSISYGNFSLGLSLLANAEPDEGLKPDGNVQDFGFAEASYLTADYVWPLESGTEIGFHIGYHEGDFAEAFNGTPSNGYLDYNVSVSKDGFSFMVTTTDLEFDADGGAGEDYAVQAPRDNDNVKFVASYSIDFTL